MRTSNKDKYLLITWYEEDGGDYGKPSLVMDADFIKDKQLDDIKGLMKEYGIKRWVDDPELMTLEKYKRGDATLVQYRGVNVVPMRVVQSWGIVRERVNE
jgi:hypothetical protein